MSQTTKLLKELGRLLKSKDFIGPDICNSAYHFVNAQKIVNIYHAGHLTAQENSDKIEGTHFK